MGKGTDKLYITHSEWASSDAFSASVGSAAGRNGSTGDRGSSFKRLPFNFCAVSLQPFTHPVCTANGTIFDTEHIASWLKSHPETNPVDGAPLKASDLIKLNFTQNEEGEYIDPVTAKPFTNNTHLVALRNTGNVFAWDTIERLNIKAKNWQDLLSDEKFTRKDIITLQDPQNLSGRDLSGFKYIKDGTSTLTAEEQRERSNPLNNLNLSAMGNAARVLKAKEAVARAREERALTNDPNHLSSTSTTLASNNRLNTSASNGAAANNTTTIAATNPSGATSKTARPSKVIPYNAAKHTTGKAAASLTSTSLTPHTSNERALLSEEEYMLQPRRVKVPGYARVQTSQGALNIELNTEFAPKAVWNFVQLAKRGYYNGVAFHRNIKNFMIQGGDPTGTGRGGQSVWGKPFEDEFGHSPLKHDARGVLSMANKGKNTNTSQFFITYRAASHLDRKHTIFGKVSAGAEGEATLKRLEAMETDSNDRPVDESQIKEIAILIDPFEEFKKQKALEDSAVKEQEEIVARGGTEDDRTTWTGKRLRPETGRAMTQSEGVGKYLSGNGAVSHSDRAQRGKEEEWEEEIIEELPEEQPAMKRMKKNKMNGGGFGNFDNW